MVGAVAGELSRSAGLEWFLQEKPPPGVPWARPEALHLTPLNRSQMNGRGLSRRCAIGAKIRTELHLELADAAVAGK